jgi:hypothetical protein
MPVPLAMLHAPSIAVSWLLFLILLCGWRRGVRHDSLAAGDMQANVAYMFVPD